MGDFNMDSIVYAMSKTGTGTATSSGGSTFSALVPIIAMFAIFYFLLIRPQQKKAKQHRDMLGALKTGDKVINAGGIFGEVTGIDNTTVTIEIAPKVRIKVTRESISAVVK
jgi:preprotein translocase subunit YajC